MPLPQADIDYLVSQGLNPDDYDLDATGDNYVPRTFAQPASSNTDFPQPKLTPQTYGPLGTAAGTFIHEAPSAVAGGFGFAKGARLGATLGARGGPWGVGIGGLAGGVAGGLLTGGAARKVQSIVEQPFVDAALDPTLFNIGKILLKLRASQAENPKSTLAGSIATMPLAGMNPSLPNVGRAFQYGIPWLAGHRPPPEQIANIANVGIGAALQPAIGVGQRLAAGEPITGGDVGLDTLLGLVFNRPNALGRAYGFGPAATSPHPTPETVGPALVDRTTPVIQTMPPMTATEQVATGGVPMTKGLRQIRKEAPGVTAAYRPADATLKWKDSPFPTEQELLRMEAEGGPIIETMPSEPALIQPELPQQPQQLRLLSEEASTAPAQQSRPFTAFEKEVNTKVEKLPPLNLARWNEMLSKWLVGNRGVTSIEADAKLPIAGDTVRDWIGDRLRSIAIRLGPKSGFDTLPHEGLHGFFSILRTSPKAFDRMVVRRGERIIEGSPEYKSINAERTAQGRDSWTPEEFLVSEAASEYVQRQMKITGETPFKQWWNDFTNHLKVRFSKQELTQADLRRYFNYRYQNDAAFKRFADGGPVPGSTSVVSSDEASLPEMIPGQRPIKIRQADGTVIDGITDDKFWDFGGKKRLNVGRVVEDKWSHGPIRDGEEVVLQSDESSVRGLDLTSAQGEKIKNRYVIEGANEIAKHFEGGKADVPKVRRSIELGLLDLPERNALQSDQPSVPINDPDVLNLVLNAEVGAKDGTMDTDALREVKTTLLAQVNMPENLRTFLDEDVNTTSASDWLRFRAALRKEIDKLPKTAAAAPAQPAAPAAPELTALAATATPKPKAKRPVLPKLTPPPKPPVEFHEPVVNPPAAAPGTKTMPEEVSPESLEVATETKPIRIPTPEPREPLPKPFSGEAYTRPIATPEQQAKLRAETEAFWKEAEETDDPYRLAERIRNKYNEATDKTERRKYAQQYNNLIHFRKLTELQPFRSDEASVRSQTKTPEFKRWFSGSKIVDNKGEPLVVYHSTHGMKLGAEKTPGKYDYQWIPNEINVFKGGHFGTLNQSEQHIVGADVPYPATYPVFLSIKNPKRITDVKNSWHTEIEQAKKEGYDGLVYRNDYEPDIPLDEILQNWKKYREEADTDKPFNDLSEGAKYARFFNRGEYWMAKRNMAMKEGKKADSYVAFYPEQIKSAIGNRGTFDSTNPDIRFSDESSIRRQPGEGEIPDLFSNREKVIGQLFNEDLSARARRRLMALISQDNIISPALKDWYNSLDQTTFKHISNAIQDYQDIVDIEPRAELDIESLRRKGVGAYDITKAKLWIQAFKDFAFKYNESSAILKPYLQSEESPFYASSLGRVFSGLASDIEKVRIHSPEGAKAAVGLEDFYRRQSRLRGELEQRLIRNLLKVRRPTNFKEFWSQDNADYRAVVRWLDIKSDGETPDFSLTDKQKEIEKVLRENLLKSHAMREERPSLKHKTSADPYYLPHTLSREAANELSNNPTSAKSMAYFDDFIKYQMKQNKLSREAALKAWKIVRGAFTKEAHNLAQKFGPIDESSGIGLPRSMREQNLMDRMARFNRRYARRLAYHDAIETDEVVSDALFNKKHGLESNEYAKNVLEDIYGVREHQEAKRNAALGVVRAGMLGPLTGAKDFVSNLTLGMQHQDASQVLPGIKSALENFRDNYDRAINKGSVRYNISGLEMGDGGITQAVNFLQRARDVINTGQGRQLLETATRIVAFGQGRYLAVDALASLRNKNLTFQKTKFLKDFVPGWEKYRNTVADESVINEAAANYVDSVQGTYDYRGQPNLTMKGSFAPILSLARWNVEKFNNFVKYNIEPARQGNWKPLLMSTVGMLIGGSAVNALVEAATGRKERTPELKEIAASDEKVMLSAYKLAGLSSMAGYAGIMGDAIRSVMDVQFKNRPQLYNNPLIDGLASAAENTQFLIDAMREGDIPAVADVTDQILQDYFQAYRLAIAHLSPEQKAELDKREKMRDLKIFKAGAGLPLSPYSSERPNPYIDKSMREFKRTGDMQEAIKLVPELIEKAIKDSKGDPERLKAEFLRLKINNYATMPNPETMPKRFWDYYMFLSETQGPKEAAARLQDYMVQNTVNKTKAEMIP